MVCMEDKNSEASESPATTKDNPSTHPPPPPPPSPPPAGQLVTVLEKEETGGTPIPMDPDQGAVVVVGSGIGETKQKRKRGRPRLYDGARPNPNLPVISVAQPGFLSPSSLSGNSEKRGRGRPRGSGKVQLLTSIGGLPPEAVGGCLIPYVFTVQPGEDIAGKIVSAAQSGRRAVCVLSAVGAVSTVILTQPGFSGGLLRYEGRFEILALTGFFTFMESIVDLHKNARISVLLAKPDGRVFGGAVAGSLTAGCPIQLVLGIFKMNISRELRIRQSAESSTAASAFGNSNAAARIPIQVPVVIDSEENCTSPTSALAEVPVNGEASNAAVNSKPDSQNGGGSGQNVHQSPQLVSQQKTSPNINVGVPPSMKGL